MHATATTPFVIVFGGRTGSSHLTSLLQSHPRVRAEPEGLGRLRKQGADADAQLAWARGVLAPSPHLLASGFKVKPRQPLDPDRFRDLLCELRPRIIHMERRNIVKEAISRINFSRRERAGGSPNLKVGEPRPAPMSVDPEELRRLIQAREAYRREIRDFVAGLELPVERVIYEDLLLREEETVLRVLDYLDVPPAPLTSIVVKATPDDLRLGVTNLDELLAELRGTPYAHMLTEVLAPRAD